jgi:hypothetical protein
MSHECRPHQDPPGRKPAMKDHAEELTAGDEARIAALIKQAVS